MTKGDSVLKRTGAKSRAGRCFQTLGGRRFGPYMHVIAELTCSSDEPYWVARESFMAHFDQADFLYREHVEVVPAYLDAWFTRTSTQTRGFLLPSVQFTGGKTQFISGRHRTAVLLPHLDELPVAFTGINSPPEEFRRLLVLRRMVVGATIELPDFPINLRLP